MAAEAPPPPLQGRPGESAQFSGRLEARQDRGCSEEARSFGDLGLEADLRTPRDRDRGLPEGRVRDPQAPPWVSGHPQALCTAGPRGGFGPSCTTFWNNQKLRLGFFPNKQEPRGFCSTLDGFKT